MAGETILLDIQIPIGKIDQATKAIGDARKEVDRLKAANKEMGDKSSEAYIKNEIKIKELSDGIRTNTRLLVANQKANNANRGEIDRMRAELSKVSVAWAGLSKEERENTEEGKKLTKQKLALTNELKRLEKQTGDTRRNVGNYSEGVKEALQQSGLFARQQQALAVAQKAVSVATGGASKGLKLFKIALISTGIGAIVVAVGSLVAAFLSTQQGIDAVTKVTRPLAAVFEKLKGLVQDLAGNVFAGLAKILNGELEEGIALIGQGLKNAVNDVGGAIKEGIKAGTELDNLQKKIEKTEVALTKRRAELNNKFEQSKSIAQDITKTEEERMSAARAAISAQEELQKEEQALLDLRIEKKEKENELNDTSREQDKELNELLAQRIEFEARATQRSTEARNLLNTINKQAIDAEEKAQADKAKAEEQKQKDLKESIQQNLKEEIDAAVKLAEEQVRIEGQRYLDNEISREEHNKRLEQIELESLQAQKELREQYGQDATALEDKILAHKIASKDVEVDTTEIAEESKLQTTEATMAALASQMNKQSATAKLLASAQTAISTWKAATAALEEPPTGLGPVFGPVLAALTTINGLANVAKINAIQLPKFATGVIGVDGPGTGTSDSINAKISAGESVITAKTTSAYAPLLASLEASMGNRPNIGNIGRARFANGVINAGMNVSRQAAQVSMNETSQLASSITQMPIFLSLTELEDEQAKYNRAKAQAQIVE